MVDAGERRRSDHHRRRLAQAPAAATSSPRYGADEQRRTSLATVGGGSDGGARRPARARELLGLSGAVQDGQLRKAILRISLRAEQDTEEENLERTYVDVGVLEQLDNLNHQVIFGRRGTGKSHLLRMLRRRSIEDGAGSLYLDLRTLGSSQLVTSGGFGSNAEASLSLFRDIVDRLHADLVQESIDRSPECIEACNAMHGTIHQAASIIQKRSIKETQSVAITDKTELGVTVSLKNLEASVGTHGDDARATSREETFEEIVRDSIAFSGISSRLEEVLRCLNLGQYFLLLDEWSSVPLAIQPYLAELIKRALLPTKGLAIKIAALDFRSRFGIAMDGSVQIVGFELGGDIAANIDLDEYFVVDRSPDFVTEVFIKVMYQHIDAHLPEGYLDRIFAPDPPKLRNVFFETEGAFAELIRAGEGVIRDFFGVLTRAVQAARVRDLERLSVQSIEEGATEWYEDDKIRDIVGPPLALLSSLVKQVVGEGNTCYFLLPEADATEDFFQALVDHRVLHLLRRGYTDHLAVGVRYNVYALDYGTYVPYKRSSAVPHVHPVHLGAGALPTDKYCIPFGDGRGLRRFVVNLE